ncbi:MAG: hypothetical protein JWQ07_669 [Ramlibacter sp.]|nr:hypothetical protein [Ramlibacter sp.]
MAAPNSTLITLLAMLPLIVWRMYARIRRMVGRQRLSKVRPWVTLVVFPLILALLCLTAYGHLVQLWWLAAGVASGAVLGVFGLKWTQFEPTPTGLFYTPNAHLGIALSLLLIGRIVYRLGEVFVMDMTDPHAADDFMRSPLTLIVFGLLAGYYIAYAVGLLRWRFAVLRAKRERETGTTPQKEQV